MTKSQQRHCGLREGRDMADYKYEIHLIAENYAENEYKKSFYALTDEQQDEVWKIAEDAYWDKVADVADWRENGKR